MPILNSLPKIFKILMRSPHEDQTEASISCHYCYYTNLNLRRNFSELLDISVRDFFKRTFVLEIHPVLVIFIIGFRVAALLTFLSYFKIHLRDAISENI